MVAVRAMPDLCWYFDWRTALTVIFSEIIPVVLPFAGDGSNAFVEGRIRAICFPAKVCRCLRRQFALFIFLFIEKTNEEGHEAMHVTTMSRMKKKNASAQSDLLFEQEAR
jgi:hypothetical protein